MAAPVTTTDTHFRGVDRTVAAYVVRPAGHGPFAGVLFLHWLDNGGHGDRSEFLREAQGLAARGVVSVLPSGLFPWAEPPKGVAHDNDMLDTQQAELDGALALLLSQPGVDASRIALVGHDYGAMNGALLAARTRKFAAIALMTPSPRWVIWFSKYWHFLGDEVQVQAYAAAMRPRDPAVQIADVSAPVLLQFGNVDIYVTSADAAEFSAASPSATAKTYGAGHELNQDATSDRDAWLGSQLSLR